MEVISNNNENNYKISINNNVLNEVIEYIYLGYIISANGNLERELDSRINKAIFAFNKLANVWTRKNISLKTKMRLIEALIIPSLTYGAETSLTKKQEHRIDTVVFRFLRRILKIRWYHKIENEVILQKCGTTSVLYEGSCLYI